MASARIRWLRPVLLAIPLAGCVTDSQVGHAVLFAAPAWFLIGWLPLGVLLVLWRRVRGPLPVWAWPSYVSAALLTAAAVWSAGSVAADEAEYFGATALTYLVFGATGYVTLLLICWRVWFWIRPTAAFSWAHLPVLAIAVLPAVPMAMRATTGWYQYYGTLIYAGFVGIPTLVVFAILLAEVLIVGRRTRQLAVAPAGAASTGGDDQQQVEEVGMQQPAVQDRSGPPGEPAEGQPTEEG